MLVENKISSKLFQIIYLNTKSHISDKILAVIFNLINTREHLLWLFIWVPTAVLQIFTEIKHWKFKEYFLEYAPSPIIMVNHGLFFYKLKILIGPNFSIKVIFLLYYHAFMSPPKYFGLSSLQTPHWVTSDQFIFVFLYGRDNRIQSYRLGCGIHL